MSQTSLWEVWIPGQCPPGKNAVVLKRDPETGRMRPRPRRRKNARGEYTPTTWERWHWKLAEKMYWGRLEMQIPKIASTTRLIVNYWWGDKHNRDEPGRMDALSCLLEATGFIEDDKFLRQVWTYRGLCRKTPGLYVVAFDEDESQRMGSWKKGVPPGPILGIENPAKVTVRKYVETEKTAVRATLKKD